MRLYWSVAACVLAGATAAGTRGAEIDAVRSFVLAGRTRQVFLFAPSGACEATSGPSPLVILHHGTGDNGSGLVARWKEIARKERFLVVAPTGTGRYGWIAPRDGPELHLAVVERLRGECPVDTRRMYAVGYSSGGDFAFYIALAESRYFAAGAILCAALRPRQFSMLDLAGRKIPIFYMVAERDQIYPLEEATGTREAFESRRWPLAYRVLPDVPHQYHPAFTEDAWAFLRRQKLDDNPRFSALSDEWLKFALR